MKTRNGWLLPLVQNQSVAYMMLLVVGFIVSLTTWLFFVSIGGDEIDDTFYWGISLAVLVCPQIGLLSMWKVTITPQSTAQVVIRDERQPLWLLEGDYVIPFYNWLISLNLSELQKTSKSSGTRALSIPTHDINGEELIVEVDAERLIVDKPTYAEFDAKDMVTDEIELLKNAAVRCARSKDFWTEVIGHEGSLSIEDTIFNDKCALFGIKFKNINFIIRLASTASDNLIVKHARLVDKLVAKYKTETGLTILGVAQMKEINERADLMLRLVDKKIFEGLAGSKPIIGGIK